jgi:hypothetical protein
VLFSGLWRRLGNSDYCHRLCVCVLFRKAERWAAEKLSWFSFFTTLC